MDILVTGGAGYVGSHTVIELLENGHRLCVIDNFSNSNSHALNKIKKISQKDFQFIEMDIREKRRLLKIFKEFKPDAVLHFAGLKAVGDSFTNSLEYYDNNVGGSLCVLNAMSEADCRKIVFSSSATVYGEPNYLPYDEQHATNPTNPYGRTKLAAEYLIRDWCNEEESRSAIALRYFNPVGAHKSGLIGEDPSGAPNNLMPLIGQVAAGTRAKLQIFGNDYDTSDGTGARDYIHVVDLAIAHLLAIDWIINSSEFKVLNVGNCSAVTVLELLSAFETASDKKIPYEIIGRRKGDLPEFWANCDQAKSVLNWVAKYDIEKMCIDAWNWHRKS